ncbi:hypothetical protein KO566_09840 [Flavobacteriaceae bacterium XHP0103]|uniref:hypothetical protein n=1 Tax=Marixanthotalea marina TaxID=2844359 RepID=UPI002989E999|nr:hypothetical protein [Marixanthotalea marina]MBU3822362.1 hypothetical protein [Marixanthotalea marina]
MKNLSYIFIALGALIAFYGESLKNTFILIGGIVLLMVGVYRLSKKIPSKYDDDNDNN